MLLQGLSTQLQQDAKEEHPKKSPKKKAKRKAEKVPNLTLDEQIKCYARIVVNQLFTELGLDEKD